MSWGEVFKINSNMKKPLNAQIRDMTCLPMRVILSSTTYRPEKTGIYKIICVGAGGNSGGERGNNASSTIANSGGGGGVAIKTLRLLSTQSYNVTVSSTASFSSELSATSGGGGTSSSAGSGGTASGGDYNYSGGSGQGDRNNTNQSIDGGGVGVSIQGLSRKIIVHESDLTNYGVDLAYGESVLSYGGGAPSMMYVSGTYYYYLSKTGQPAAVIIIPLEMEE